MDRDTLELLKLVRELKGRVVTLEAALGVIRLPATSIETARRIASAVLGDERSR